MSVTHKLRRTLWKRKTSWSEVLVIAAAIVFVASLIMAIIR